MKGKLYSFVPVVLALTVVPAIVPGTRKVESKKSEDRPNIVVILADDLGFSDVGCYGGEVKTPNIDYLAANGLRFKRFYNTSRCCPTRASLLTGLYNQQAGIGEMTTDQHSPGYRGALTENTVTLAEVLKSAGYQTGMSGKWHVSNTIEQGTPQEQLQWLNHQTSHPLFSPLEQYPLNRGFDKYFGNIWGVVDYFDPFSLVEGIKAVEAVPKGYYHTDAINDKAVQYIKDFSIEEKPFFLYVAQTAPHWPLQAPEEETKKYQNTYKVGWDAIRESRYQRMVKMGLIDPKKAPLSPRIGEALTWENNPDREWDARAMAVHAAMIDRMDQGIGRIVAELRRTGKLDNTLILFMSDNGASPEDCAAYGPGFDRPGETRDGKKIIYPVKKRVLPGSQEVFASIGPRWANVANTPYQYAKAQSYEGGIHTPMIAFWPKGIKQKGKFTDHWGHVMDLMPTFLDLAHATYPKTYKGHDITPFTGLSFASTLKGQEETKRRILFNEHLGARYIRDDVWKMVSLSGNPAWHLYRINDDQTEMNDVAADYPDVVARLSAQWEQWARNHQVFPKPK